ncbi:MAG: DUF917 domain-containing protein [Acidimicrobiia bacterium]
MRTLTAEQLEPLALGAAFLGAGGGGDPYIGMLMARSALTDHPPVAVLDPAEVPDDAVCAMSAVMGAPTVLVEKLPGGTGQMQAFHALEHHLGRRISHILCAEVGGLNSMLPVVAAARLQRPLVDCDAMGRAFPEIQMSTPTLAGNRAAPMAIADDKGNTVVVDVADNHQTERIARSITVDMGAAAFIAVFPQSGAQVKESMIGGTLRLAESIGAAILHARASNTSPLRAGVVASGGHLLFEGKISDVARRTEGGFALGSSAIEGFGLHGGTTMMIEFQNENLVAAVDDKVVASVPDLITLVEVDSGRPVTTEELRYGHRVAVVGVPCNHRWRSVAGLELVGPRRFGYDIDYVPVEQLARRSGLE